MSDMGGGRRDKGSSLRALQFDALKVVLDIKNYDIYTKVEDDFSTQTSTGASLSLIGWIIIAVLVMSEIAMYLGPMPSEHMIVDTTLGQRLKINIDITFHAITCAEVNVDAMDVAGDNQVVSMCNCLCVITLVPDVLVITSVFLLFVFSICTFSLHVRRSFFQIYCHPCCFVIIIPVYTGN